MEKSKETTAVANVGEGYWRKKLRIYQLEYEQEYSQV